MKASGRWDQYRIAHSWHDRRDLRQVKAPWMSDPKAPSTPAKGNRRVAPRTESPGTESRSLDAFIDAAHKAPVPAVRDSHRLIFALDATASRQPTWDMACSLHTELFNEAERLGNLAIQLCYYRGHNEFRASRWATTPATLRDQMLAVSCLGGATQITRLMQHAAEQAAEHPLRAVIFIGDCFEENEADLVATAGQLALRNVPVLIFQEGHNPVAQRAFAALARTTRGALLPFAPGSIGQLGELLGAAVQFAVGGREALERHAQRSGGNAAQELLRQIPER